jgi:transcriptional regulator with PAS, ATPase and Fis domain
VKAAPAKSFWPAPYTAASPRAQHPFGSINMAALTSSLFEAEFFGHTKGAFTGAETRPGRLPGIHEPGNPVYGRNRRPAAIPFRKTVAGAYRMGEFSKLGSSTRQKVDLRFIAATNENLEQMMDQRRFRKDLYYRIRGGWLHLPPLRERREDIFC